MISRSAKLDSATLPYARSSVAVMRAVGVLIVLSFISMIFPDIWAILVGSIIDAYVGVTTFVALTLFILYGLERWLNIDFATFVSHHPQWQVMIASALGALPGCGGAVMVVTQYVRGSLTFGSLVATLTATMGDAAFILLASEPQTGLLVMGAGFVVGAIAGYITDMLPLPSLLARDSDDVTVKGEPAKIMNPAFWSPVDFVWVALMIPGIIIGIGSAMQYDMNLIFDASGNTAVADNIALVAGIVAVITFLSAPSESMPSAIHCNPQNTVRRRVVAETSFITLWVIVGFALFDITMHLTGADLRDIFSTVAPLVPLMAIIVGWLPGCGPQIIVTTLYINGIIPLSALLGNAISNDGDALFPALALSPRAAILATVYSTVPALIVAYGWYFWAEA